MSPTQPPITAEGQAAANRIAEFRNKVDSGATAAQARTMLRSSTRIKAADLANPPKPVSLPAPVQPRLPTGTNRLVQNVARDVNGFISAQSEEAKQLKELQATYGALADQSSLSEIYNQTRADFGITPDTLQELKDIDLQLTDMNTTSDLTKTRISGASGQTFEQGQREVTQEDRENAVRSAGLAARAAVIRGNIETGTKLAQDAVNILYQDRTLKATNLLNQISILQGQVDKQTAQLLEQDKRAYEAELSRIKELKDRISTAMVSGATQVEIGQLNDPTLSDEDKLALAQGIVARGATQMRNLEIASKNASIAASNTNRLLALASAGDQGAIKKLGFDPRAVKPEIDPTTKRQLDEKRASEENLIELATKYKNLVAERGFENTFWGNQETVGQYRALRTQMTASYKDAKKLGTLDQGVLTLMEGLIGEEPTSGFWSVGRNATGIRSGRIVAQIDQLIEATQNENAQTLIRLGINPLDVSFSSLTSDESAAIDEMWGIRSSTTSTPFNPANYFK